MVLIYFYINNLDLKILLFISFHALKSIAEVAGVGREGGATHPLEILMIPGMRQESKS